MHNGGKEDRGMVTKQKNVRVLPEDKERIERFQEMTALSQPEIIHKALNLFQRQLLSRQIRSDFKSLDKNPELLKEYVQFTEMLDASSGDGFVAE